MQVLQSVLGQQGVVESGSPSPSSNAVSLVFAGGDLAQHMDRIATNAEQVSLLPFQFFCGLKVMNENFHNPQAFFSALGAHLICCVHS